MNNRTKIFTLDFDQKYLVLVLSLIISAFLFIINILFFIHDGINEKEELILYFTCCITIPIITVIIIFLIEKLRLYFCSNNYIFYSSLVIYNLILLSLIIIFYRILALDFNNINSFNTFFTQFDRQVPSVWDLDYNFNISFFIILLSIIFFIFFNFFFIFFLYFTKDNHFILKKYNSINSSLLSIYPFLVLLILFNFSHMQLNSKFGDLDSYYIKQYFLLFIVGTLSLLSLFHSKFFNFIENIKFSKMYYVVFFLIILFLIYDPGLRIDPFDQYHYLQSIIDLRAGKSLLIDIQNQYGVFIFYILKFIFDILPMSLKGLSFLVICLYFIQYSLIYLLFYYITNSKFYSFLSVIILIILQYFIFWGPVHSYSDSIRFLPGLLLIFLEYKSLRFKSFFNFYNILVICILGFCFLSGIDYFIFGFTSILCMKLYKLLIQYRNFKELNNFLIFNLAIFIVCVFFQFLFFYFSYLKTNTLPDWNNYLQYIFWYSASDWMLPIRPFGIWIYFILIPLLAIYFIFYKKFLFLHNNFNKELYIISGLIGLAFAQFAYFLGRSHTENLFSISSPIIFIFLVGIYFLSKNANLIDKKHFRSLIFCIYFVLFFSIIKISPNVYKDFFHIPEKSRIYHYEHVYSNLKEVFSPKPSSDRIEEIISLVQNYSANKNRIGIFLRDKENTEVLMFTNKAHIMQFNFLPQVLRVYALDLEKRKNDEMTNKKYNFWNNELKKIKVGDILYVNFTCDFFINYNFNNYDLNHSYLLGHKNHCYRYNGRYNENDKPYMHGRTKVLYSYLFKKIKDKYILTILKTTDSGISVVKLNDK